MPRSSAPSAMWVTGEPNASAVADVGFDLSALVPHEEHDPLDSGRGQAGELVVEERASEHGNEHLGQIGAGDVAEPGAEATGEDGDGERHSRLGVEGVPLTSPPSSVDRRVRSGAAGYQRPAPAPPRSAG